MLQNKILQFFDRNLYGINWFVDPNHADTVHIKSEAAHICLT